MRCRQANPKAEVTFVPRSTWPDPESSPTPLEAGVQIEDTAGADK